MARTSPTSPPRVAHTASDMTRLSCTVLGVVGQARSALSGEKARALVDKLLALSKPHDAPVCRCKSLIVPSLDAEARRLPSGKNAKAATQSEWLSSVPHALPVPTFHNLNVQSSDPEVSSSPLDENDTAWTRAVWPSRLSILRLQSRCVLGS